MLSQTNNWKMQIYMKKDKRHNSPLFHLKKQTECIFKMNIMFYSFLDDLLKEIKKKKLILYILLLTEIKYTSKTHSLKKLKLNFLQVHNQTKTVPKVRPRFVKNTTVVFWCMCFFGIINI